ncbi:rCG59647 [Rattus norvegicus]|uniref:RCG59647 n=1 Tax=Rattus norvegicus TaxID=10116 RepID=A6HSM3_RAT|nr:rCG59647 [Rattus norvegicus]
MAFVPQDVSLVGGGGARTTQGHCLSGTACPCSWRAAAEGHHCVFNSWFQASPQFPEKGQV